MVFQVRGVLLPEREERSFWIDGDRLRTDPVPGAELVVDGGWLLPGLVDVHTHPGTEDVDVPFSDDTLRRHLTEHRDSGVLLVRTPGSAARLPSWVDEEPEMPRVRSAGRWPATPGRFFPGFGRDVSEADLARAAVEEAKASSGWCKVIADWKYDEPALPQDVLTSVVQAVHAVGGRVARPLPDRRRQSPCRSSRRRQPGARHAPGPWPDRADGFPGHRARSDAERLRRRSRPQARPGAERQSRLMVGRLGRHAAERQGRARSRRHGSGRH